MLYSAGVGRTGTLIALDILMQELTDKGLVNIFDTILQLRIQRINMVQTEVQKILKIVSEKNIYMILLFQGQYKYIHECVKEAILDLGNTSNRVKLFYAHICSYWPTLNQNNFFKKALLTLRIYFRKNRQRDI
jgi:Protein-tyrosine phosphatase